MSALELDQPVEMFQENEGLELSRPSSLSQEIEKVFYLAVPMALANLAHMMMGVVDIMMVGKLGEKALGAVALGSSYTFSFIVLGMGVLLGLDPLISYASGANRPEEAQSAVRNGIILSLIFSLPSIIWMGLCGEILGLLKQPEEVIGLAREYVWSMIPGVPFIYLFYTSRQSLQSVGKTLPALIITLAANVVNGFLNWVMIYGNLGFPAWGVAGAGYATSLSRMFMTAAMFYFLFREPFLAPFSRWKDLFRMEKKVLREILFLGFPLGLQFGLEVWGYTLMSLGMGWLGPRELAAHQILCNLVSLTFMLPLAISSAASVRVGYVLGEGRKEQTWKVWQASMVATFVMAGSFLLLFLTMPRIFAEIYTREPHLISMVLTILPVAAVFQIFDGLQVVHSGVLRGAKDTRIPTIINLIGYWLIGIPMGFGMALGLGMGAIGFWWGILGGTTVVACLLLVRIYQVLPSQEASVLEN